MVRQHGVTRLATSDHAESRFDSCRRHRMRLYDNRWNRDADPWGALWIVVVLCIAATVPIWGLPLGLYLKARGQNV